MSKAKILIVEDDGIFAEDLKSNLEALKYLIAEIVPTGNKVLSFLTKTNVDLILMDIRLRGELSGIDVAKEINSKYDIPIVFLSAFTDPETVELAKESEPYGFLSKPVDETELQRTIDLALYKHSMESKLKKSEERFKQISSSAHDGIILINEEDKITFWNKAAEKIFGFSFVEAKNKNLFTLIAPEIFLAEYEYFFDQFLTAHKAGKNGKTIELVSRKKDGTLISTEFSLSRFTESDGYNTIAIIRDISERKLAEQEQLKLSTALKQTGESILITDVHGLIEYVNPAFENISGYTWQEIIGKKPSIFKSGKQDTIYYKKLWDTISRGDVWKGRFINKKKDGSLYTEEATISPVRNNLGNIVNFVAVKRDITTKLILEKKIRQTQNLRIMGLYANLIVHDFNNQLHPIIIETDQLLETLPENDPLFQKIQFIKNSANKASNVAKQILMFSEKETLMQEPLKIQTQIEEFYKVIEIIKPENVTIQLNIDNNCNPILANATQISQLILNLCTNAYHAMKDKPGILKLSIRNVKIDSAMANKIGTLSQGNHVQLSISDTGHGIDHTIVDKIFRPSFSTKGSGQGFGLGLSSVYNIVKNHKGEIVVDTTPGVGTTFHTYFPAIKDRSAKPSKQTKKIQGGNENILLVDDNESIEEMLKISLERNGYHVTSFNSSLEALEKFISAPNDFDIVITDQTMPGLRGDLFAIELLKIRPDISIILCTGYSATINKEKAEKIGIKKFLFKPFSTRKLAQTIREILD